MRVLYLVLLGLLWAQPSWAFLTDTNVHLEPASPPSLPTAGSTAIDPTFGTKIMRLTDSDDSSSGCINHYSNEPALNVNSTMIHATCTVDQKNRFKVWDFDAATMTRSNGRVQANRPAGLQDYGAHWSRTSPNKFYAVGLKALYEITIPDGSSTTWTNTVIRDFSAHFTSDNLAQMSMSADADVFAFHYAADGVNTGYIVYKRSTNTILLKVSNEGPINEVEIDKTGRYLVALKRTVSSGGDGSLHVWDLQGTPVRTTVTNDVFNHRAMGNGFVVSNCATRRLCKRNLATPNSVTYLTPNESWRYGDTQDNFSMTGTDNWMMSCRHTTDGQSATVAYQNECLEISTTGDQAVRRHVHHHAVVPNNNYALTPRGSISRDGRFITFTSNWGNPTGRTDVYVAQNSAAMTDNPPPQRPANLQIVH